MEQNEDFKRATTVLNNLQAQLVKLNERDLQQEFRDVYEDIQTHFVECMEALEKRKSQLLQHFESLSKQQQLHERAIQQLKESIEGSSKVLNAGTILFKANPITASTIWKGIRKLNIPQESHKLDALFPVSIFRAIESHGQVNIPSMDLIPTIPSIELHNARWTASKVTTLAGSERGFKDGIGKNSQFSVPGVIGFNPIERRLYIGDESTHCRMISMKGEVTSLCTNCSIDGVAISKQGTVYALMSKDINVLSPTGAFLSLGIERDPFMHGLSVISLDPQTDGLYAVTDHTFLNTITPTGNVSWTASFAVGYLNAKFKHLCWYGDNALLMCDAKNDKIISISLDKELQVTTIAQLYHPQCAAPLSNGQILVTSGHQVFILTPQKGTTAFHVKLFAGKTLGFKDGKASDCQFNNPCGIAVDESTGTCFVCDKFNHRIRCIQMLRK